MLGRYSLHQHTRLIRQSILLHSSRPVPGRLLPLQSRFYAQKNYTGRASIPWSIVTFIVGFVGFSFLYKRHRGLGILGHEHANVDPMNPSPMDDVRKQDADKLPVLQKEHNPAFDKRHVHVIFVLGFYNFG